jgi:hypothetical protein
MTRINVGYPVEKLSRQHLLAEHREMKRIPNTIVSGKAVIKDIPDTFRLGAGHVKFFYNKLGYLLERYRQVYQECQRRGFNVQNYESAWSGVPAHLMGTYTPTLEDTIIISQRIKERSK